MKIRLQKKRTNRRAYKSRAHGKFMRAVEAVVNVMPLLRCLNGLAAIKARRDVG